MFPQLAPDHIDCFVVQGHRYRLARLRLLDFHRAREAVEEGHRAVERAAHSLAVLNEDGA